MLSYDLVDQKERCLMKLLKRILISLLILLTVNLYLPKITFAEQDLIKKPLEIRSTPEEDIPTEKVKKTSGWTWLIGVSLIGGAFWFLSQEQEEDEDTGGYTITW